MFGMMGQWHPNGCRCQVCCYVAPISFPTTYWQDSEMQLKYADLMHKILKLEERIKGLENGNKFNNG